MRRVIFASGLAVALFGLACGTRVNEALLLALDSGSRTAVDVFVSDLYSDLPNLFTFPPPSGEPDGGGTDGDDANGGDGGDQQPPDGGGGDLVGDPVAGEALYLTSGCGFCHCDDGSGECLPGSPSLLGSTLEANREAVVGDGPHMGGKNPELTEQDLVDIVAFLGG